MVVDKVVSTIYFHQDEDIKRTIAVLYLINEIHPIPLKFYYSDETHSLDTIDLIKIKIQYNNIFDVGEAPYPIISISQRCYKLSTPRLIQLSLWQFVVNKDHFNTEFSYVRSIVSDLSWHSLTPQLQELFIAFRNYIQKVKK